MTASITVTGICIILLASSTLAWHGPGHYMVAHIAQSYLQKNNPEALDWANKILAPYTDECGENLYPFVEAATWADKIKDQGWHIFDNNHFINNHWYDKGAVPMKAFDNDTFANIIFAIAENINTLSSTKDDPYGSSKSIFGKSLSLRTLIHFLGDIHQPLHAEERVTPDKPDGDMGGNLFLIKHYDNKYMDNLHFVWDEMFMPYNTSIRTNLPPALYKQIEDWSLSIQAEYPFEALAQQIEKNNTQQSWGDESFEIARSFAYVGITDGEELPQAYMDKGRDICRKRVALGGYRLGVTLDYIYKHISSKGSCPESNYVKKMISFMYPAPRKQIMKLQKSKSGNVSST